jgi:hypothetical protein
VIEAFSGSTVRSYGTINNGIVHALAGGTIYQQGGSISNALVQADGRIVNIGGAINFSTLTATNGGTFTAGGGHLRDDTISAGTAISISDGQSLIMDGTINNQGTISLNSTGTTTQLIVPLGSVLTLTSGGTVVMSDNANNWIGSLSSSCWKWPGK